MKTLQKNLQDNAQIYQGCVRGETELESQYNVLKDSLKKVEQNLEVTQSNIAERKKRHEEITLNEVVGAAQRLNDRNDQYTSGSISNYDTQKQEDQRVMSVYTINKDVPVIREALQSQYDAALSRKKHHESIQETIQGGIVIREHTDNLEVYVTAEFEHREEGLMGHLTEAVALSLLDEESTFEGPTNESGIVKLTVTSNYSGLVDSLRSQEPTGFKQANVEYNVIMIPELEDFVTRIPNTPKSPDKKSDGSVIKNEEESKNSINELIAWTNVEGINYYPINDIRSLTGFEPTSFYKHTETELKQGPIKSIKIDERRFLEANSLIAHLEKHYEKKIELHSKKNAAIWWQDLAVELLEENKPLENYQSRLRSRIADGTLQSVPTVDGETYFCRMELANFFTNYFAKAQVKLEGDTIPRNKVPDLITAKPNRITSWIKDGKLKVNKESGEVTKRSAQEFLRKHRFYNGRWVPRNTKKRS